MPVFVRHHFKTGLLLYMTLCACKSVPNICIGRESVFAPCKEETFPVLPASRVTVYKAVQGLYIGFLEQFKGNALARPFAFRMLAETLYKGNRTACPLFVKDILPGRVSGLCGGKGGDGGMVSFNHYANGAVGDFLYRRIAGIEPTSGGYRTFRVEPCIGGGITRAEAGTQTPYGRVSAAWRLEDNEFILNVTVPVSAHCTVKMPGGSVHELESGSYTLKENRNGL